MTKAEREEAAREKVCPRCHAGVNRKCRGMQHNSRSFMPDVPGAQMKTIHAERLALVEECHCGNPGTLRANPFDAEIHGEKNMAIRCQDCYDRLAEDI